jgi:hypothetical protein
VSRTLSENPSIPKRAEMKLHLPPELDRALRKAVLESGRSRNDYVANIIAKHLSDHEESNR